MLILCNELTKQALDVYSGGLGGHSMPRPRVFFDFSIGSEPAGRYDISAASVRDMLRQFQSHF